MSFLPEDPFLHTNGRLDPLLSAAGLTIAEGHGVITPMVVRLGHVDSDEAWHQGLTQSQAAHSIHCSFPI